MMDWEAHNSRQGLAAELDLKNYLDASYPLAIVPQSYLNRLSKTQLNLK